MSDRGSAAPSMAPSRMEATGAAANRGKELPAPARGVVLAHGGLAEGLVAAVRQIAGVTDDALVGVPHGDEGREEFCERAVSELRGPRTLLFTDLPSGGCHLAALIVTRERPDVPVITGVNLPMLLDFVFNRRLDFDELVPRLAVKGQIAIAGNRPRPQLP